MTTQKTGKAIKRQVGHSTGGGFTRPIGIPEPRPRTLLPRPDTRGVYPMLTQEMAFNLMVAFGSERR